MDELNDMEELNVDDDADGEDDDNADDEPFELDQELIPPYSQYVFHKSALKQFHQKFNNNPFGYDCNVCDRLWFKKDLKIITTDQANIILATVTNDETKEKLGKILVCTGHYNYIMPFLSSIFDKIYLLIFSETK